MHWRMSAVKSFVRSWLLRSRMERDMDREMQFHVAARAGDLEAQGLSRAEAERQARAEFGDVVRWKEAARDARGLRLVDDLRGDVRYAFRMMRRAPGFTAAAVVSLALGIGASTGIFGLVDVLMLRPLPVQQSRRARARDDRRRARGRAFGLIQLSLVPRKSRRAPISSPMPCSRGTTSYKVGIRGLVEPISGQRVTTNYHSLLGVPAVIGRTFVDADRPENGGEFGCGHQLRSLAAALRRYSRRHRLDDHRRSASLHHRRRHRPGFPRHSRRLVHGRDDAARRLGLQGLRQLVHDAADRPGQAGSGPGSRRRAARSCVAPADQHRSGRTVPAALPPARCRRGPPRRASAICAPSSPVRCNCSWLPLRFCWSSPASIWPACCWRATRHGSMNWACGWRLVPAG